jgi:hypothetical protein
MHTILKTLDCNTKSEPPYLATISKWTLLEKNRKYVNKTASLHETSDLLFF